MTTPRAVGIYRALVSLYPRRFREEYGRDMALLFETQLRNEHAGRVWARALVDLAINVPAQHLEARMHRSPNVVVPVVFAAVAVAGLVLTIVGGTNLGTAAFGLAIAAVSGVLALTSWRRTRAVTAARPANAHWWKLVAGGTVVFASTVVTVNITGEVSSGWWLPMMLTFLAALATSITGLVLGLAHLATNRPRNAAS